MQIILCSQIVNVNNVIIACLHVMSFLLCIFVFASAGCSLFFSVATLKSEWSFLCCCHWWLSFEPFWICHQID